MSTDPEFVVEFPLSLLASRVAHGIEHMGAPDLITRTLVLATAAALTVWAHMSGHTLLPLLTGVIAAGYLTTGAVEFYAAGAYCDQVQVEKERDR